MAYAEINNLLKQSNIEFSAAEAHGMATGMLCANLQTPSQHWLQELLSDGQQIPQQHGDLLLKFFKITHSTLTNEDYGFSLLLPGDETPLSQQAQALKNWCHGFLFGVSLSGNSALNNLKNSREILKDITEFTKLDTDVESDDDEQALTEIIEYIRVAILLLKDELAVHHKNRLH